MIKLLLLLLSLLLFTRGEYHRPLPPADLPPAVAVEAAPTPAPAPAPALPVVSGQAPFGWPTGRTWNDEPNQRSAGFCPWLSGRGWSGALVWPVAGDLATTFHPGHKAIDINAPVGTAVHAAAAGVVVWAGADNHGGGLKVILSHGSLWHTRYVHLESAAVTCGQQVAAGQLIGTSGMTGTSWPHLHFSIWRGATAFDPCAWLGCEE